MTAEDGKADEGKAEEMALEPATGALDEKGTGDVANDPAHKNCLASLT